MSKEENRRSSVRYDPDRNSVVTLKNDNFSLLGLVRDESGGGCAAVFQKAHFDFTMGESLRVKLNENSFRPGSIVWTKEVDKKFIKAGIKFENS